MTTALQMPDAWISYIKCFYQRTLTNIKKVGVSNNGLGEGGKKEEDGMKFLESHERLGLFSTYFFFRIGWQSSEKESDREGRRGTSIQDEAGLALRGVPVASALEQEWPLHLHHYLKMGKETG